jgi:hypothetical protein
MKPIDESLAMLTRRRSGSTTALAAVCIASAAAVASVLEAQDIHGRLAVHAVRVEGAPPRIDGMIDEAVWQLADAATDFVQYEPDHGAPASERTEVRVLYDDDAVYVGALLHDSGADSIVARLARRDEEVYSDWFWVMIDSYCDRRSGFAFGVNPRGVRSDALLSGDVMRDANWDAIWDVAARRDANGWTAEFRLPLSQLRFNEPDERADDQTWGVNFRRQIARRGEIVDWSPVPPDAQEFVSRFGDLRGLRGLSPRRRVEIMPYAVSVLTRESGREVDPLGGNGQVAPRFGMDLRYGLTTDFTLSATVNPDFGQVEADPSVVNLSAFEMYFPEQRPFFVEGADLFRLQYPHHVSLVHTRRIGRSPQGSVPDEAEHWDLPNATTILGAAKITGRTSDGWTLGVLDAATSVEHVRFVDGSGFEGSNSIEPFTNYMAARVAKDFCEGQSALGVLATATNRHIDSDGLAFLHSAAYSGGIDARHRFAGGRIEFIGSLLASHVRGDSSAIARTQRAAGRRYDRPDATHVVYEPSRTSLSGVGVGGQLRSLGAGNWRWGAEGFLRSPGLEFGDLGFQFQDGSDAMGYWGMLERRWLNPGKLFRRWSIRTNLMSRWTLGGERWWTHVGMMGDFQFQNLWNIVIGVFRQFPKTSPEALRGGPALRHAGGVEGWTMISGDPRRKIGFELFGGWWLEDDTDGYSMWVDPTLLLRPSEQIDVRLTPSLSLMRNPTQYVSEAEVMDEMHYVLGQIEQRTVSLTARLSWTFTPNLSLQFYGQPFVSAGSYSRFKEVADPNAVEFGKRFTVLGADQAVLRDDSETYDVDLNEDGQPDFDFSNPDFNYKAFNSNLVLRWEYRLGSTLFVVWSQNRGGSTDDGSFSLWRDVGDLYRLPSTNSFIVKMSYWLGT